MYVLWLFKGTLKIGNLILKQLGKHKAVKIIVQVTETLINKTELTEFKASSAVAGVLSPVGLKTKENTKISCDIACTTVAFNFLCL